MGITARFPEQECNEVGKCFLRLTSSDQIHTGVQEAIPCLPEAALADQLILLHRIPEAADLIAVDLQVNQEVLTLQDLHHQVRLVHPVHPGRQAAVAVAAEEDNHSKDKIINTIITFILNYRVQG